MGEKGRKGTVAGDEAAASLLDAFGPLGDVTVKKMFGGHGIFLEGTMFAIVDPDGASFLRADQSTSRIFEEANSERHARMPYWQVPDRVLEDEDELLAWGRRALDVAQNAK